MKTQARQTGLTLVELMVSLAIGLIVVGAVFVNYLNSSAGSRHAAAMAQVTDDASLALGILRNHIAMAGYSKPTASSSTGMTKRLDGSIFLLGCKGGFAANAIAQSDPAQVTCVEEAADGASDSILVRYEADDKNAPTVVDSTTHLSAPADCTGNALPKVSVGATPSADDYYVLDNRFQIDASNAQLECRGNGNGGIQPLLDNVVGMHITYGMGTPSSGKAGSTVVRYVNADQVGKPDGTTASQDQWNNVISVRVCIVVRSTNEVLASATRYRDCDNNLAPTPSDRRIYRAFTTTVTLNNRIDNSDPPTTSTSTTTTTTP